MFGFRGQGKGLAVVAILLGLNAPARAGDEPAAGRQAAGRLTE